jgi:hypothetical protein
MNRGMRVNKRGKYGFLGAFSFSSLILASPVAFGQTCSFEGDYKWTEKGTSFLGTPAGAPGVSLVEVGQFKVNRQYIRGGFEIGEIRGESEATFNFPVSPFDDPTVDVYVPSRLSLKVDFHYYDGSSKLDTTNCKGKGRWFCKVTKVESTDPLVTVADASLLLCGTSESDPYYLNPTMFQPMPLEFTFSVVSDDRMEFIITNDYISSSGTAYLVK